MGPNTLQEAILYFANSKNCREYLVAHRWPDGVTCPRCIFSISFGNDFRDVPFKYQPEATAAAAVDKQLEEAVARRKGKTAKA